VYGIEGLSNLHLNPQIVLFFERDACHDEGMKYDGRKS
jgi:hypothetical protein